MIAIMFYNIMTIFFPLIDFRVRGFVDYDRDNVLQHHDNFLPFIYLVLNADL